MSYKYSALYDTIFMENKFNENRKSIVNRFKVLYRYSFIITLRGFIQGAISFG